MKTVFITVNHLAVGRKLNVEFLIKTRIDESIEKQTLTERNRWREVMKRLLDCIKYLAPLALRGHSEDETLSGNTGNFLSLLKLLSIYDPIMKQQLDYVQSNPVSESYLSPLIQNECIGLYIC